MIMFRKIIGIIIPALICIPAIGGIEVVSKSTPTLLSYLRRVGVVGKDGAKRMKIESNYFTQCEIVSQGPEEEECVRLVRSNAIAGEVMRLETLPSILCANQGRTAVVWGAASPEGVAQMYIFGKDGLVAACRQEGTGSNTVMVIECRMSSEVRDMMSNESCAERFPCSLFGLDLSFKMPESSQLVEDGSAVMVGGIQCSEPHCKDSSPVKVDHPIFTEISRCFEKKSGRMVSFELQCVVLSGESESGIIERIWSRILLLAGFVGGKSECCSSSTKCYRFKRVDEIEAMLFVSSSEGRLVRVGLTVKLPEDFQSRNYKSRRQNGWRDPRIIDF